MEDMIDGIRNLLAEGLTIFGYIATNVIVLDADYLRINKSYNDAFNKYAEAIDLDGNRAAAFIGRSGEYYDLGLYENGIEDAIKAINFRVCKGPMIKTFGADRPYG